jgi:sialic acid synthase SpsE
VASCQGECLLLLISINKMLISIFHPFRLEAGVDHFERTNTLLSQVCKAVSPIYFYTCLWECVATNSSIRLPAITYVIDHFNKRIGMSEQTYLMGRNVELMVN